MSSLSLPLLDHGLKSINYQALGITPYEFYLILLKVIFQRSFPSPKVYNLNPL
jgi:hypothetical protein